MFSSPLTLEVSVVALGVFLLLLETLWKDKKGIAVWAIAGLTWIFLFSFFSTGNTPELLASPVGRFYTADTVAMFFKRLALLTTIIVLVMSMEYRHVISRFIPAIKPGAGLPEFFCLPVFTCAGLMFMASAVDFLSIFVSIELVTISLYILVAFMRKQSTSLEAGVKYLILGALSTGFLVYGVTWIFGVTGETNLALIAAKLPTLQGSDAPLLFGIMLVLVGLGFKVAAAPFQLWVPDVYQGAPTPITALLSVGSKAAGFIVLMRVLQAFLVVPHVAEKVLALIAVLAALSLIYGNLAALPQDNLKRLLAYSSIAHAGYLLVAVASVSAVEATSFGASGTAIAFYLAGYLLMTLLAFLVMIIVANCSRGDDIVHFNGLSKRSPFLAFAMLAAMLSLAGVPFTVGFYGKFLVFAAAVQQHQFVLAGIGAVTVAAGFYYYIRVVAAMYWKEPEDETPITMGLSSRIAITALTAAIFIFGILPGPILNALQRAPTDASVPVAELTQH